MCLHVFGWRGWGGGEGRDGEEEEGFGINRREWGCGGVEFSTSTWAPGGGF